jgi:hypothetical protein
MQEAGGIPREKFYTTYAYVHMNGACMKDEKHREPSEKKVRDKKVEHKIRADETIEDIMRRIEELQEKHPDREFFLDGDEFAICSRPRKSEVDEQRT